MAIPEVMPTGQARLLGDPGSAQGASGSKPAERDWRLELIMSRIGKEQQASASQQSMTIFSTAPRIPFAVGWAAPKKAMSGVSK